MFQLLIVDDEESVVDSLVNTISWSDIGIEEVHAAYSAEAALNIAGSHAIDILITDIQMPEMDGLTLIEKLKKLSPKIRSIILSGHDTFQYAQKALQFQTFNYLLKPVVTEDLIDTVRQAIDHIRKEWEEIGSARQFQHILQSNMPVLKDQLLNDLIKKKPIPPQILSEKLDMLGLPFRVGDQVVMMLLRVDENFSGGDLRSLSLFEYAVTNIAEEVFQGLFELWHCVSELGFLVFLVKSSDADSTELLQSYAVKLQNNVQTFLKGNITVCVSKPRLIPDDIAELYRDCVTSIRRNAGQNKSFFITVDNDESKSGEDLFLQLYEPPLLSHLLELGNWDEALAKIRNMLGIADPDAAPSYDQLLSLFLHLSSAFSFVHQKTNGTVHQLFSDEFEQLMRKYNYLTKQNLYHWSEQVISELKEHARSQLANAHENIVAEVHSYIQQNLSSGVSVQSIADHIKLHPVYLSKVYKAATGQTIGEYLLALRMEKAAFLLTATNLKVIEISSRLGYFAPPHFIKIFKNHYGCTPQEFRLQSQQ